MTDKIKIIGTSEEEEGFDYLVLLLNDLVIFWEVTNQEIDQIFNAETNKEVETVDEEDLTSKLTYILPYMNYIEHGRLSASLPKYSYDYEEDPKPDFANRATMTVRELNEWMAVNKDRAK